MIFGEEIQIEWAVNLSTDRLIIIIESKGLFTLQVRHDLEHMIISGIASASIKFPTFFETWISLAKELLKGSDYSIVLILQILK